MQPNSIHLYPRDCSQD